MSKVIFAILILLIVAGCTFRNQQELDDFRADLKTSITGLTEAVAKATIGKQLADTGDALGLWKWIGVALSGVVISTGTAVGAIKVADKKKNNGNNTEGG